MLWSVLLGVALSRRLASRRLTSAQQRSLQLMEEELVKDLNEEYPITSDFDVAQLLKSMSTYHDNLVMILNNRVFVPRIFLKSPKRRKHAGMMKDAVERLSSPNVMYLVETGASGPSNRFECGRAPLDAMELHEKAKWEKLDSNFTRVFHYPPPRFAIAKKEGYERCGILVPNPYIGNLSLWQNQRLVEIEQSATERPFVKRDGRLFWRGHISSAEFAKRHPDCSREVGNYARFAAATLTFTHPERSDVRCVKCEIRNETEHFCDQFRYDDDMKSAFAQPDRIRGNYVDEFDFSRYKHVLNLPGSTTGSYSMNLNHLWMLGSIVFLWENSHVEWYYPALKEGLTHLSVNKSTALAALDAVENSNSLTERLRQGARRVARDIFCVNCLVRYFATVVDRYRKHFSLDKVLDDPTRLRAFFAALDCKQMDLIEIVAFDNPYKVLQIDLHDFVETNCSALVDIAQGTIKLPKPHMVDYKNVDFDQ